VPPDNRLDIKVGDDPIRRRPPRPWLSVLFDCCRVYQRVYRNAAGDAYVGGCPRCGRRVRFPVGPGGTSARAFIAS